MNETIWLFRILPYVVYAIAFSGALTSGVLVYNGLATKLERRHLRLRLKNGWKSSKKELALKARSSGSEKILKAARYPLGLSAIRVNLILVGLLALLVFNYIFLALLLKGHIQMFPLLIGIIVLIFLYPGNPISLTHFGLTKFIDYRRSKRNAELFSLYDMLVSEIEMMHTTRVNAYSLIKAFLPYFNELKPLLTGMLARWTSSSRGPHEGIDWFAEEIGTSEAKSLATILKTFDEDSRDTLLVSLRGMEDMFVTSQIENNRRKRKLFIDMVSLPVKIANWLILLNFVIVIIMMVLNLMGNNKISL